jgi:hypothetical protein
MHLDAAFSQWSWRAPFNHLIAPTVNPRSDHVGMAGLRRAKKQGANDRFRCDYVQLKRHFGPSPIGLGRRGGFRPLRASPVSRH